MPASTNGSRRRRHLPCCVRVYTQTKHKNNGCVAPREVCETRELAAAPAARDGPRARGPHARGRGPGAGGGGVIRKAVYTLYFSRATHSASRAIYVGTLCCGEAATSHAKSQATSLK